MFPSHLRRHEQRRASNAGLLGQLPVIEGPNLAQAERLTPVKQLHCVVALHRDVVGLDVSVNDALRITTGRHMQHRHVGQKDAPTHRSEG